MDDYAFLIRGLIELYEAIFDVSYLKVALELNSAMLEHFWDDENNRFYLTPDDGGSLFIRKKEIHDSAIPSGNSVAMLNLLCLGCMAANPDLEEKAAKIGRAFSQNVKNLPLACTQLMVSVDCGIGPSCKVVVAG